MDYSAIKRIANIKKITLKSLSQEIGMTVHGLHAAMKNNTLKIRDLEKISKVLDVSITDFFNEGGVKKISEMKPLEKNDKRLESALYKLLEGVYIEHFSDLEVENKQLKQIVGSNRDQIRLLKAMMPNDKKYTVDYTNQDDVSILTRTFKGTITMDDVISSWEFVIENGLVTQKHKGIISDYRNTVIQVEIEDISKLEDYLKDNMDIIKNLKMAVIVDSPKITIPLIFKKKNPEFHTKPFITMEDAIKWIRQ